MLDLVENTITEDLNGTSMQAFANYGNGKAVAAKPGSRQRLAIEFDTNLVKAILVDDENSVDSARCVKVKFLPSDSEHNIRNALQQHILEMGIRGKIHTSIAIPRHLVHAKLTRVPSHDPAELQEIIRYQLQNELPIDISDIVYDFRVVAREKEGYAHVMVVIARRHEIERYAKIARNLGLIIDSVILSFEAIYYSFLNFFGNLPEIKSQCIALIDVDFSNVNVIVIDRGELLFCRSIKGGVNALIENMVSAKDDKTYNEWLTDLSQGIADTFQFFKKEKAFSPVEHVILSGWLPKVNFINEFLTTKLQVPVAWFDTAVPLDHLVETGADGIRKNWFSVSALLGMVSEAPGNFMDLRSEHDRKISTVINSLQKFSRFFILLLYLMLLSVVTFEGVIFMRQKATESLNEKVRELQPGLEAFQRHQALNLQIRKKMGGGNFTAATISQFFEKLPAGMHLRSLTFIRADKLIIRGVAQSLTAVFDLPQVLQQQPAFKSVQVNSADRRAGGANAGIVEFELNIILNNKGAK